MLEPVVIDGDGVRLRPWRPGDPADLAAAEAVVDDPIVRRWSSLPLVGAAAWLAVQAHPAHPALSLAITAPGPPGPGDAALGNVALMDHDAAARRAELAYWLVPAARGRGLALAAARALGGWAFTHLGVDALRLSIDADNAPSLALARRLGATPVPGRDGSACELDRAGVARPLVRFDLRGALPVRAREHGPRGA